jgi:hypothetical protein
MSNNLPLAGLIGAAVFFVVRKQAQAATVKQPGPAVSFRAPQPLNTNMPTANVNADMWTRLLGSTWGDLAAGSAFIGRNIFGQATSADGKPINSTDFYHHRKPAMWWTCLRTSSAAARCRLALIRCSTGARPRAKRALAGMISGGWYEPEIGHSGGHAGRRRAARRRVVRKKR